MYIVTHKKCNSEVLKNFHTIQAGAAMNQDCGADYQDNIGENISLKNPCYREMTALYWLWKNCHEEYCGLCHYRRFFSTNFLNSLLCKKASYSFLIRCLEKNDADIIVRKSIYSKQRKGQAIDNNRLCHASAIIDSINAVSPEYMDSYEQYRNGYGMHGNNMFFAKKELMNKWCEWIFPILEHMETSVGGVNPCVNSGDAGYIGEHLFNVWIIHNKLKIKELHVTNLETNIMLKLGARVRDIIYQHIYK